MSNFPLYDNLIKDVQRKNLTIKECEDFIEKVLKIDNNGRELVYVLIQFYYGIENLKTSGNLPYGGKKERHGKSSMNLTWDLAKFPQKLKQILYKFVSMHTKKMQEELVRPDELP